MSEKTETTRSLIRMGFDDYMITIVDATFSRGNSAPMGAIRSLTQLISTLSTLMNDGDRAVAVNELRDVADLLEAPMLKKKN